VSLTTFELNEYGIVLYKPSIIVLVVRFLIHSNKYVELCHFSDVESASLHEFRVLAMYRYYQLGFVKLNFLLQM